MLPSTGKKMPTIWVLPLDDYIRSRERSVDGFSSARKERRLPRSSDCRLDRLYR